MVTEKTLKKSAIALENGLQRLAVNNKNAANLLTQIGPYIEKAKNVSEIEKFEFERLRFDYLFIEGPFSDDSEISELYSEFANQFEGLDI